MTQLAVPEPALVALVGISGSGKSTFARRHFAPTEVLSSDAFRAMVADDENDQSASDDAFAALHFVLARRLRARRLTVVDATNVLAFARAELVALAREYDVPPVAIVLDVPPEECWARTTARPERMVRRAVLLRQHRELRRSLSRLAAEGFESVHVLSGVSEVDAASVVRQKRSGNHGTTDAAVSQPLVAQPLVARQPAIVAMGDEHAAAVLDIYRLGIEGGDATFESEAPAWEEFSAARLAAHRFVAVDEAGVVLGWVACSSVSDRCVYAGVVEHSVYVRPTARGRGVGRALLDALIASTEAAGVWTIQSGVFCENVASLALHHAVGFRTVGKRERIGKQHGRWRDVILLERRSPTI